MTQGHGLHGVPGRGSVLTDGVPELAPVWRRNFPPQAEQRKF
jgi:hypothetical protein